MLYNSSSNDYTLKCNEDKKLKSFMLRHEQVHPVLDRYSHISGLFRGLAPKIK